MSRELGMGGRDMMSTAVTVSPPSTPSPCTTPCITPARTLSPLPPIAKQLLAEQLKVQSYIFFVLKVI